MTKRDQLFDNVPSAEPSWTQAAHYVFAAASHCCCSFQLIHAHAQQADPEVQRVKISLN